MSRPGLPVALNCGQPEFSPGDDVTHGDSVLFAMLAFGVDGKLTTEPFEVVAARIMRFLEPGGPVCDALADAIRREWLGGESPTGPGCSRPAAGGSH